MLKQIKMVIALGVLLLQTGCATHLTQQEVASEFWTAIVAKDIAKAKTFATPGVMDDIFLSGEASVQKLDLMPLKVEKGQTCLPTRLTANENGQPRVIAFDTILKQVDDDWKIDIEKTTKSLRQASGNN
jgi:hypothetical protein